MKSQKSIVGILLSFSFVLLITIGCGGMAVGQSLADDLAIKGYDTVAYLKLPAAERTGNLRP